MSNNCNNCIHGDWNDGTGACTGCNPMGINWKPRPGPVPIKGPVNPTEKPDTQYQRPLPIKESTND